jgi:site-specific DNA-cytosine methylase
VFVVASARAGFNPGKILFESDGLRRDIAPSRFQRKVTPSDAGEGFKNGSHWDGPENPHPTLNQSNNTGGIGASNQELFSQRGSGIVGAYRMTAFGEYADDNSASTVKARDYKDATDLAVMSTAVESFAVRRLTPIECERLQGFPDNHTAIPWKGKDATDCPDGQRYKAIGNSMAVPVMAWIGQRIISHLNK